MGAGQSSQASAHPSHALHVLRITPGSPASETDIEPLFDFVVGCDSLDDSQEIDATQLERVVSSFEGRALNLVVWSSKTRELREIAIVPSRKWSCDPKEDSLLGLTMRMCQPEFSLDCVWHVLEVLEGSPAESAGLVPYGDYIVGYSGGVLNGEDEFYELVEQASGSRTRRHVDKPLRVYIYSADFGNLREVVLIPNRHWGGEGLLGCVFGFGLLHRIPLETGERTLDAPREESDELDDYSEEESELFVPADSLAPQESSESDEYSVARKREDDAWQKERETAAENHHGPSHDHNHSQDSGHSHTHANHIHTTPNTIHTISPTTTTPNGRSFSNGGVSQPNPAPPLSPSSSSGNEGDRDSVAESETTETNSLGSLTSVD